MKMKVQDKVVLNILQVMKEKNIDEQYLIDNCDIKEKRLRSILDVGTSRVIRIDEIGMIANALKVPIHKIFDTRKYED